MTKTEAVKIALRRAVEAARAEVPLIEKIKVLQDRVAALGIVPNSDFDMKKFSDELYENL